MVPDYKFVFYSRSNLATPSKSFIQASRTWSFKELSQEARYILDNATYQIYKDDITLPEKYIDFNFNYNSSFVYLAINDNVLIATPCVQICFYIKSRMFCNNQPVLSPFKGDDVHMSSASSQPVSNYSYIFVGEIIFLKNEELIYDETDNTIWFIFIGYILIYYKGILDLSRINDDSFKNLNFSSTIDIGIKNCIFYFNRNSEYCLDGKCLTSKIVFHLYINSCVNNARKCDCLTRFCYHCATNRLDWKDLSRSFIWLFYNSDHRLTSLNIYTTSKEELSKDESEASSPERVFTIFFNSLETHLITPLTRYLNLVSKRPEKDGYMLSLFEKLRTVLKQYEVDDTYFYYTSDTYMKGWNYYRTESLSIFEDNICFNEKVFYMFKERDNKYTCQLISPVGYYLNVERQTTEQSSWDCVICESATECSICSAEYQLAAEDKLCVKTFAYTDEDGWIIHYIQNERNIQETNYQLFIETIGNSQCTLGYVKIGDNCEQCARGCLECLTINSCSKCDSNYILSQNSVCEQIHLVFEKIAAVQESESSCEHCFQIKNNISKGCKTCTVECDCSLIQLRSLNEYAFKCTDALFSSSYLNLNKKQLNFSYQQASTDNAFNIITKSNSTFFSYALDLNLILNTTNCYFDPQRVYTTSRLTYTKKTKLL